MQEVIPEAGEMHLSGGCRKRKAKSGSSTSCSSRTSITICCWASGCPTEDKERQRQRPRKGGRIQERPKGRGKKQLGHAEWMSKKAGDFFPRDGDAMGTAEQLDVFALSDRFASMSVEELKEVLTQCQNLLSA